MHSLLRTARHLFAALAVAALAVTATAQASEFARPATVAPPHAHRTKPVLDENLFFSSGSDRIDVAGSLVLRRAAALLAESGTHRHVIIDGYSDAEGSSDSIARIARARADAAFVELLLLGAEPGELSRRAAGVRTPASSLAAAEGALKAAFGRSVRIRVVDGSAPSLAQSR